MYAGTKAFRRSGLLVVGFLVTPVLGTERWVDNNCPSGTGSCDDPYCTIQEAINASADGDTIWVRPGTYTLASALSLGSDKKLRSTDGSTSTTIVGQVQLTAAGGRSPGPPPCSCLNFSPWL